MSPPAVFSFDFHRFEPIDVFTIEEHEPHCTDSLVDLERMAREDGSLDNNPVRIVVEESPSGKQGEFTVILFLNIKMTLYSITRVKCYLIDEDWSRREGDGREGCHHDCSVPEVSLVLVFVPVGVLAEDGTGGKPPPAHLEDEPEIFLSVISQLPHSGEIVCLDLDLTGREPERGCRLTAMLTTDILCS